MAAARSMPGVCAVFGSSWSLGTTLTPCVFQSIGACRLLIAVVLSSLDAALIWSCDGANGVGDEARGARSDLEFLFPGGGGGRARLLRGRRARPVAGAGVSGRPRLSRNARRQHRF